MPSCASRKVDAVTESIADGLSVAGLVVGFPLLLLGFMVSLEKLETWGLRESDPGRQEASWDMVDAAVHDIGQAATAPAEDEATSGVGANRPG